MLIMKPIWLWAVIISLSVIVERVLFIVFPNYLIYKGFSSLQIGSIFSIASFVLIVSRFFIGKLSDAIGRKKLMLTSLLIQFISIGLFPFVNKFYEFAIIRVLKDTAETITKTVKDAILADTFRKRIRLKVMATLGTVFPFSRAVGMVIGFILATYLSLAYSFYFSSILILIAMAMFSLYGKENKCKVKWGFSFNISKNMKIVGLIAFFVSLNFTITYLPAFFILAKNLSAKTNELFIIFLLGYVASTIVAYTIRNKISKFGKKQTLCFTTFLFSFFILMYPFAENVFYLSVLLVLISIAYHVWRICFKTIMMDNTIKNKRGEQIGFVKTVQGLGDAMGPLIGGFLIDFVSLSYAFFVAGAMGFVGFLIAFLLD